MSPRLLTKIALTTLLALTLGLAAGCTGGPQQEVADDSGWFHVQVPAKWQAAAKSGSIYIVADKKLPENEDEAFKSLAIQIYVSDATTSTAVDEELTELVAGRAKSRGWTSVEVSDPQKTQIGKRDAYYVDIKANDGNKRPFAGRIALIHTNKREALVVALASADAWAKSGEKLVSDLYTKWYWHEPATKDATATPQP